MKKIVLMLLCVFILGAFTTGCTQETAELTEKSYAAEGELPQTVVIDARDRKIEVGISQDGQLSIDYFESEKEFFQITQEGGVLRMEAKTDKEWTDYIGIKAPEEQRVIRIWVPESLLSSLELSTTNGDITVAALQLKERFQAKVNNGNIFFDTIDAGTSIQLEAKNGDITGKITGGYDDYTVSSQIKKGDSNLPEQAGQGQKTLDVAVNNGDIDITFQQ